MAVPKRRHSHTRGKKRRTHWKLGKPSLTNCAHCGAPRVPHRICASCGYYKGEANRPMNKATQDAVKAWQKANKMPANGKLTQDEFKKLTAS